MASWIVHLRIAERLLSAFPALSAEDFYVGSIAPDSGVLGPDRMTPTPSRDISHWRDPVTKAYCPEKFYKAYIPKTVNRSLLAFYVGYYVHLHTDSLWVKEIYLPAITSFPEELAADPNVIFRIKQEWYAADKLFLNAHPDYLPFSFLRGLQSYQDPGLPYYTPEMICAKIREAVALYEDMPELHSPVFSLFSPQKAELFVRRTTETMLTLLHDRPEVLQKIEAPNK